MKTSFEYSLSTGPASAEALATERARLVSVSRLSRAHAFFRFKLAAVLFFVMAAAFAAATAGMPVVVKVAFSSFVLSGALWLGACIPLLDMAGADGVRRSPGFILLLLVIGFSLFGFLFSSAYAIQVFGARFGLGLLLACLGALFVGFMATRGRSCAVNESEQALAGLEPISLESCSSVLGWCHQHPELEAYRSAVASQARMLTHYEYDGMRELVAGLDARTRLRAEEKACARLLDPAPVSG